MKNLGYIGMCDGHPVYRYSDGSQRFDALSPPLVNCKYCGALSIFAGTMQCNNCWEVASRVRNMPNDVLQRILVAERRSDNSPNPAEPSDSPSKTLPNRD